MRHRPLDFFDVLKQGVGGNHCDHQHDGKSGEAFKGGVWVTEHGNSFEGWRVGLGNGDSEAERDNWKGTGGNSQSLIRGVKYLGHLGGNGMDAVMTTAPYSNDDLSAYQHDFFEIGVLPMESARCTQNNFIYSAQQFAAFSRDDLTQKRNYLACPGCGGHAFFRKETQNDREACFGARPHADECPLRAMQAGAGGRQTAQSDPGSVHTPLRLVVDFDYGISLQGVQSRFVDEMPGIAPWDEPVWRSGLRTHPVQHVRLRPLLRLLTSTPLCVSQQLVDIAGMGTYAAADFFRPFSAMSGMHSRSTMLGFLAKLCRRIRCLVVRRSG